MSDWDLKEKVKHFYKRSCFRSWEVKASDPKRRTFYESQIKKIEQKRGRGMLYPYLGSGFGKGVYVELMDGSVKMDLLGGIGVQIFGHSHPDLLKVNRKASLSDITMQGHLLVNQEYLKLNEKLVALASKNSQLQYVWLTTSGSMANENALKMARQKNFPRKKILAFQKAFAGRTGLMSEITDNPAIKEGLPSYNEVLRLPFYDSKQPTKSLQVLDSYLEKEERNICVFICEVILGEGGYQSAPPEFFISLFEKCRKQKIAIWIDEVQTFCRTGTFFAFEKWGLGPYVDLCTIGKSLQLAATFFTPEYNPRPGLVAGTFSASTSALSSAFTILEQMEKHYIGEKGKIVQTERLLKKMLENLKEKKLIQDYNVFGLMMAFTLKDSSKENTLYFLQKLFQSGVIGLACGRDPYRVRFLVPAVITSKDIETLHFILSQNLEDKG